MSGENSMGAVHGMKDTNDWNSTNMTNSTSGAKPYQFGFILGRFQPLHIGHERMIEAALANCERVLVLVGSAQLQGTVRNPFGAELRMRLLRLIYRDRIELASLNDYTHEGDHSYAWGRYLLQAARRYGEERGFPALDLMITGDDEERGHWFPEEEIAGISRLVVPRIDVPISATRLREAIAKGDRSFWETYTNPVLHGEFDSIREALLRVEAYRH
ncbi:adenylyltransferase/cytidyltransferase family protein [Paenibacillus xylaniclasticus]|uniref:adenylyltransferase/cytidyltransferase family protein n=1 Tax=Paenibacillus xylaniclasticus TaxID=588083 RepID=UPI000FDB9F91|nr:MULTISPECIES: adenylyltransferase/cytidyltransferase family protein [Paenibacillus]GFN31501.1 hypothetical protein PCURB6_17610 [Paenibacillus curdlanolyticus]